MTYAYRDPEQAARDFFADHLHQGDLIPHLAVYFGIGADTLDEVLSLELTDTQREKVLSASSALRTGLQVCVDLHHHARLIPHDTKPIEY